MTTKQDATDIMLALRQVAANAIAARVAAQEADRQVTYLCMQAHEAGYPWHQIGAAFGVSGEAAWARVKRLRRRPPDDTHVGRNYRPRKRQTQPPRHLKAAS